MANQWYKEGQYWEPKWMGNNAVTRSQGLTGEVAEGPINRFEINFDARRTDVPGGVFADGRSKLNQAKKLIDEGGTLSGIQGGSTIFNPTVESRILRDIEDGTITQEVGMARMNETLKRATEEAHERAENVYRFIMGTEAGTTTLIRPSQADTMIADFNAVPRTFEVSNGAVITIVAAQ